MNLDWHIRSQDRNTVQRIQKTLNCSLQIAAVLTNRGISSASDAISFFSPLLKDIKPPFCIKDLDKAVQRLYDALIKSQNIVVFSDYDTDGITGAAILFDFLKYSGANVSCYTPHREKEGYGLKPEHIKKISLKNKTDLIITVDCGTCDYPAIEAANNAKIDVIVTDHHNIENNKMPPAFAFVNPKRKDCDANLGYLAGVGVVFYLIIGLRSILREQNFWNNERPEPNLKNYCDLVAVGTVADMVPLCKENRIFAKAGIDIMKSVERPGLTALFEAGKIGQKDIDSEDIAFKIAPRLNAAGRMEHASIAFDLLCCENVDAARGLACTLNSLNEQRQEVERQILFEIEDFLGKNSNILDKRSLVLYHDWHEGVLGIAAARLARKYWRPAVLISTKNGFGSARSIEGIDLHSILGQCSYLLENFGGHCMAAGFKIKHDNIKEFIEVFENAVSSVSEKIFTPKILIDMELKFKNISSSLIDDLELIGPYGNGNPVPIFMAKDVNVMFHKIVGKDHLQMRLAQSDFKKPFSGICFNIDAKEKVPKSFKKIAYSLQWNRWKGGKTPQLLIKAVEK